MVIWVLLLLLSAIATGNNAIYITSVLLTTDHTTTVNMKQCKYRDFGSYNLLVSSVFSDLLLTLL